MRLRLLLPAVALAASLGRVAGAQPEPSASGLKMAQDLVDEGRALGQRGEWGEALARFRRAASISPRATPQLAFYVGYAEARVGKLVAADVDLKRAVELARGAGNEQVAKAAQAELPELEARTPALTILVTADGSAAAPLGLQIDGAALDVAALGSPVPLDPGEHTVVLRFAAGAITRPVALVERQRATMTIEAPPGTETAGAIAGGPTGTATPRGGPAPAASTTGGGGRAVLGLVVAGAGGATLVASGVFYLMARSAMSPVTSACPSSPCSVPNGSPLPSDYNDAHTKQTIALVLAGVGGAAAAAGLVVLATGGGATTPTASSASRMHVAPWLAPGAGGAALGGRF